MLKRIKNRIFALCTCASLVLAMPMSMDGCMENFVGGVGGAAGTTTDVQTNATATATATGGSATATASTGTSVHTQTGAAGGGWLGGMPNPDYGYMW
jgi:hypothetical protein